MKYVKAPNVYKNDIIPRLVNGQLVLPPGQWIRCGTTTGPCSRYCGVTATGTLVVAHPRNRPVTTEDFNLSMVHWRGRRAA
jgi:hypothetical protein